MECRIYDLLPEGQEHAMSRRNLMNILGMSDRSLRLAIAAERKAGALILSSTTVEGGGYYRPANSDEIAQFVSSMERRAKATLAAASEARRELKRIEKQESEVLYGDEVQSEKATGCDDIF